jgi:hypothetical protein
MNSTLFSIKSFAFLALAATAVAAAVLLPATPPQEVVKLERVVIVGKRSAVEAPEVVIAQLPRVVITGRSTATTPDMQLASASTKAL